MKKILYILLALIIIAGAIVFVSKKSGEYVNGEYGFSFTYPKEWTVRQSSKENPPVAWGGNITYAVNLSKANEDYFSIIAVTDKQLEECKNYFTEETLCPLQIIGKNKEYTFAETHHNGDIEESIGDEFYKIILPSFKGSN